MLDIYRYGDEVLREPTQDVTKFDDALAMLVDAMFDTMIEADGVGLAGPQVGVSSRLFVVDTRREGERIAFINPDIVPVTDKKGNVTDYKIVYNDNYLKQMLEYGEKYSFEN